MGFTGEPKNHKFEKENIELDLAFNKRIGILFLDFGLGLDNTEYSISLELENKTSIMKLSRSHDLNKDLNKALLHIALHRIEGLWSI